jgi:hypothetical protein
MVGEYLLTTTIAGPPSSDVDYTAAQLALSAGDWEVGATLEFAFTTSTGVGNVAGSIQIGPLGSATLIQGSPALWHPISGLTGSFSFGVPVGVGRLNTAAPATVSLVARVLWVTSASIIPTGALWARRVR